MKKLAAKFSAVTAAGSVYLTGLASSVFAQSPRINVLDTADFGRDIATENTGFAENLGNVLDGVLTFVMVIAALLVLLYLIWGGIEWITSGGDKGKTESARNKITAAVIGLVVLAAAYAIFRMALAFLGFSSIEQIFQVRTIGGVAPRSLVTP